MVERQVASTNMENLSQNAESFRLLVESVRDYAIFMLDPTGLVLTWNAGAERFKGYRADEIIGQHFSRFYPPEALDRRLPEHELRVAKDTGYFEDEGWRVKKDGSLFWANVVITAMRNSEGQLLGFAKVTRDITQRRSHEEALRQSEERFRLMVEGVAEYAIFMLDVNGRIATWNVGAERIKGYTAEEAIGRHFSILYPDDARESGWPDHELQVAAERGSFVDNGWRVRKDGAKFWANVTITALHGATGRLIGYAKLTRDLTESRRADAAREALIDTQSALAIAKTGEHQALVAARHDSATGLPNREHFNSLLTHDIAVAARQGFDLAVMFFDLDKFKDINDTHGHAAGDDVLKQIAARLLERCRVADTLCRTGGDEFLHVLINPKGRANIERIASALLKTLAVPVVFEGLQIVVRSSIGISLYPEHGKSASELISNADAAMYAAKKSSGSPGWAFYDGAPIPRVT